MNPIYHYKQEELWSLQMEGEKCVPCQLFESDGACLHCLFGMGNENYVHPCELDVSNCPRCNLLNLANFCEQCRDVIVGDAPLQEDNFLCTACGITHSYLRDMIE